MRKIKLKKRIIIALSTSIFSVIPTAYALPDQGMHDNSNVATIVTSGNIMNITGKGANNIINWKTFSINNGEIVKFMDKNNYLNIVNGIDTSRIYGTISGGGIVYLVNPYGILFGSGATLDNVGTFIASTRDISDINQQNFLNNPSDINGVLYTDLNASRNKDYYPDDSPFVPKISVAEIKLTNVPESATKIVLDGPRGVILKNTATLDTINSVITRKTGGEIGIGSTNGSVNLTDTQASKISLINGNTTTSFDKNSDSVTTYHLISDVTGLRSMGFGNYMLANNITAGNFTPIDFSGTFDGMGYDISDLVVNQVYSKKGSSGLFSTASGTIRNLGLVNVNIAGGYSNGGPSSYRPPNYTSDAVGAVAAHFTGSMSNVYVKSSVDENDYVGPLEGRYISGSVRGFDRVGGLVGWLGYEDDSNSRSEIRNSYNDSIIGLKGVNGAGGVVGVGSGYLFNVYNNGNIRVSSAYNDRYHTYYPEDIGGIAGSFGGSGNGQSYILSAYNTGKIVDGQYVGGIVGHPYSTSIGNAYNFGEIVANSYSIPYVGSITGLNATEYVSNETGEVLKSYYQNIM